MKRLDYDGLFGPERIRDSFGITYEIERLGYRDSALFGPLLEANFRLPGQQTYDVGCFRLDCIEFLSPLMEDAA